MQRVGVPWLGPSALGLDRPAGLPAARRQAANGEQEWIPGSKGPGPWSLPRPCAREEAWRPP